MQLTEAREMFGDIDGMYLYESNPRIENKLTALFDCETGRDEDKNIKVIIS